MIATSVPFDSPTPMLDYSTMPGKTYQDLLAAKVNLVKPQGFQISPDEFHPSSERYPHQFVAGRWALNKGRALLGLSFGLQKTSVQLQMMQCIHRRTQGKTLITCPLGVKHQFCLKDGPRLGMNVQYVTCDEEALNATTPYLITNYERIREGNISAAFIRDHITGATLDEGDTLRSLGSKTYDIFNQVFKPVPYRFVATATPDPNSYLELINYAVFLDVAEREACLNQFFGRNTDKAGDLQLYPHQEEKFWLWVASWALFVTKPSDLGFSDEGFDLPEMEIHWHRVATNHERAWDTMDKRGQRHLFADSAQGISQAMREKRASLDTRIAKMMEVVAIEPEDTYWLLWHDLEAERESICKALPDAKAVYGTQDADINEQLLMDFSDGKFYKLAVKPEMAGAGNNFQYYCHHACFVGVGYKFKDFIQALHRILRFQQLHKVIVHIIHTDAEDGVVNILRRKWRNHEAKVKKMVDIVKKYGLVDVAMENELRRTMGVKRAVAQGQYFTIVNNDCVLELENMADNYVHAIITSIPFSKHYGYVNAYEDFGHNVSDDAFFEQMDYLTPQLLRVLRPGRMACIHVKDLLSYGSVNGTGRAEVIPFSDMTVDHFRKHGFKYAGRIPIITDVVRENSTSDRLTLKEKRKDATKMGVGLPEYVLLFYKLQSDSSRAYADDPVVNEDLTCRAWQKIAQPFWRSSGNRPLTPEEIGGLPHSDVFNWYKEHSKTTVYDWQNDVELARGLEANGRLPGSWMIMPPQSWSPWVWTDVNFMRSLNADQYRKGLQRHVCPFAFDVVERLMDYTMPGEIVLDPFDGLGTTIVTAIRMGRYGYGIELNPNYWRWSAKYAEDAELQRSIPTLFDLMEVA